MQTVVLKRALLVTEPPLSAAELPCELWERVLWSTIARPSELLEEKWLFPKHLGVLIKVGHAATR